MASTATTPVRKRRRLQFGLATMLIAVVPISAWLAIRANRKISVVTMLKMPRSNSSLLDAKPESLDEFRHYKAEQLRLLNSALVAQRALKRPGISQLRIVARKQDAAAWLINQIEIESAEGSEFVTLRMRGKDPAEMAPLLDAVLAAYFDVSNSMWEQKVAEKMTSIENELKLRTEDILLLHKEIRKLESHHVPTLEVLREDLEVSQVIRKKLVMQRELLRMELRGQRQKTIPLQRAAQVESQ